MSLYGIEKPGLLTPTGWEGVQKYVREEPDYMVIDDGITPYAASLMNKDIPSEEILADPHVKQMTEALLRISGLVEGLTLPITSMEDDAGPIPQHIDTFSGHTFLINSALSGHASYRFYDKETDESAAYEDVGGNEYMILRDPSSYSEYPIQSRQMVIINGRAVQALPLPPYTIGGDGLPTEVSIPHSVHMADISYRKLYMAYLTKSL